MLKTRASKEFWLLLLVALLVLGSGLGLRDPWPSDEPRFTLVAKQMIESGDWLFPHRGTELYSDKPPMLMWFEAAFYTVFGNWRIAFLLPSLLAALGTLWCVYDLGRRLWTRKVGLYAAWALLFAFQFTYQSKKAQIDPLVMFWITLANYGLLRHLLCGPNWKLWTLGWFAAGLGTITKGVGALSLLMILPAVVASLMHWPRVRVHAKDWRFLVGPIAFAGAAALWLVPMVTTALSQDNPEYKAYLNDILFRQTAGRYAKSWDHAQPPYYHLVVMATAWLPTMFALLWAFPAWARRLRRRDARYLLPLAWWALIILFFSIPSGKRDVYIMPALPMACLALGPLLPGIVRKLWARRIGFAVAMLFGVLFLGAGLAMWFGDPKFEAKLMSDRGFTDGGHALFGMLMAMGAFALGAALWHRVRNGISAMLWALGGIWVLYGLLAYPLLNPSSSAGGLMASVGQRIGPDAELGLIAWKEQNLLMADRPAATFGFNVLWPEQLARGMRWQAEKPGARWLLVQEPALSQCVDKSKATFAGVSNRRRWWLVPAAAADAACTPAGVQTQNEADGQDD
ncbi:MAG: glycosyltransferase family 39 protein [Xanthomonadaceae bacterium]|nr:glycosyltransferase family 39 protein [Xanthomonadaceae bacterium]